MCAEDNTGVSTKSARTSEGKKRESESEKRGPPSSLLKKLLAQFGQRLAQKERERKRDGKCRYEGPFRFLLSIVQTF